MIKRYKTRRIWDMSHLAMVEDENGEWMRADDVLPELERLRAKVRWWEDIEFAPGRIVVG